MHANGVTRVSDRFVDEGPAHLCSLSAEFEWGGVSQVRNPKILNNKAFLFFAWTWGVSVAIVRCDTDGWRL